MSKEKSLDQKAMDLFAEGKISQEGVKALLMQNPETNSNPNYSQPIVQTQEKPIKSSNSNSTKRILLTTAILLAIIAGPIEYTKYRERKQQERTSANQGQQTQTQNQVQNYSPQPVQQVEQEPIREEIIQETIVGLNQWVSSPKLNYEFAVKKISEKRIDQYTHAQYIGTDDNIPRDQIDGWRSYFWDLIIVDIIARSKTNNSVQITPQYFYLGGCPSALVKDKTLVEMVSGTTKLVEVTRLTPAEMRLVYCEGSNMNGNGNPSILPRSGIMRLSTEDDEYKSLVEIGRMENQELQY